jgi:hypothetical protein
MEGVVFPPLICWLGLPENIDPHEVYNVVIPTRDYSSSYAVAPVLAEDMEVIDYKKVDFPTPSGYTYLHMPEE